MRRNAKGLKRKRAEIEKNSTLVTDRKYSLRLRAKGEKELMAKREKEEKVLSFSLLSLSPFLLASHS
jgi:hypothetical protein